MSRSIEVFLDEFLRQERGTFNDTALRIVAVSKKVEDNLRTGDIQAAESYIHQVKEVVGPLTQSAERLGQQIRNFDQMEYLHSTFPTEFHEACKKEDIYLEGTFPRYEVFPFRVEVIPDKNLVLVNETKVRSLRPSVLAKAIKKEKETLEKAPFNVQNFLYALLRCYDLLVVERRAKTGVKDDVSISLKEIYKNLTLLLPWRKHYPIRLFAFDLYRLLKAKAGQHIEIDERTMKLGSVRDRRKAIRVVDETGREQLYGGIQFRRE